MDKKWKGEQEKKKRNLHEKRGPSLFQSRKTHQGARKRERYEKRDVKKLAPFPDGM